MKTHTCITISAASSALALAIGLTSTLAWSASSTEGEAAVIPVQDTEISSEITGIVEIVNTEQRMLTIKTADGRFEVIHVPEEAKRLDEVKIGNRLTITATEAVLVDLVKGAGAGAVGTTLERTVDQEPGPRPAGTLTNTLTLYGRILSIDPANRKVTVQGADETRAFTVDDPTLLGELAVGDGVVATFIRSVRGKIDIR
jgi:hypothetical protein